MEFVQYKELVSSICVGKQLPDAVYLHESAAGHIPRQLQETVASACAALRVPSDCWNVIKLYKRDFKVALLHYPAFFTDSYPALHLSHTIDLSKNSCRTADYSKSDNPPILHRKETFLDPDHPDVSRFRAITEEGERAGLYDKSRSIGFKQSWERLISRSGYQLVDGHLVGKSALDVIPEPITSVISVDRHLTAIDRNKLSLPMQHLARHGYLDGHYSILDYGCGKGDDVRELEAHGIDVHAWDPAYRTDGQKRESDIVNLGYVINVIEERQERTETLRRAYGYARRFLVVSAMVAGEATIGQFRPYKDGVLTSRNTFQKYYTQSELRNYLESTLDESAVAISPGVFFVFRDKLEEQSFLAERQHVRRTWNHLTVRERRGPASVVPRDLLERNRDVLDHFWTVTLDLGRIPANQEFEFSDRIRTIAGSHKKAFDALTDHYGLDVFEAARNGRRDDLLVYFALGLFSQRKPYRHMPESLKRDIKAFFASYKAAIEDARNLLFSVASPALIEQACLEAHDRLGCGALNPSHSFVIHSSLLGQLPAILRVYVGCALQLYGDIDAIDLVKVHMRSGKVSLMRYDDFVGKAVPELTQRIKVRLRDLDVDIFDYAGTYEPQPLYLKSKYVNPDFPHYEEQRRFDSTLEKTALFDLSGFGPSRHEFLSRLQHSGLRIVGFRLRNERERHA